MELSRINHIIDASERFLTERQYSSYDQFDALQSPLINFVTAPSDLLRRIAIQVNKNIPLNIRSVLGYGPMVHTKCVSDMLTVYSTLYRESQADHWRAKAYDMFQRLQKRAIHTNGGLGWGLNFPYTTRFVNAKEGTPNLYNTLNAAHSLLDYYEVFGDEEVLKIIPRVISFMFDYLGYSTIGDRSAWFRYYPGQTVPNFNVNATSASFFVRANIICKKELVNHDIINSLLNFLLQYQNSDGSWFYALSDNGKWIDGYHTGFILDALLYLDEARYEYAFGDSIDRGIRYYRNNLFTSNCIPKFFHDKLYPIEAQNCAQAIQTISKCILQGKNIDIAFLDAMVEEIIAILYDEKGYFYYKQDRVFTNKQFYSRWSHTPMIMALQYYKRTKNFCD